MNGASLRQCLEEVLGLAGQVPARCGQLVELHLKNDRRESAFVLSRICAYCVPVSYPLPLLFKRNKGFKAGYVSSHGPLDRPLDHWANHWTWIGMTTLVSPGLSSQSVSGYSGRKGPKNPKRTGMTTLGNPGLSSQSVSGFSGRKGPKNLETDWDVNPGKPRLVIPVCFRVFWPKRAI